MTVRKNPVRTELVLCDTSCFFSGFPDARLHGAPTPIEGDARPGIFLTGHQHIAARDGAYVEATFNFFFEGKNKFISQT
jgi:hypothetical protein